MGNYHPRGYRVELTGRRRPFYPEHALGSRSVLTSYEYHCPCGHIGWSNHMDLARQAGDTEALRLVGLV